MGTPTVLNDINKNNALQVTNRWSLEFNHIPGFISAADKDLLDAFNDSIIDTQTPSGTITSLIHENKGTTSEHPGKLEYGRDLTILMTDNELNDNWAACFYWMYLIRNENGKAALARRSQLYAEATLTIYDQVFNPTSQWRYEQVWPYNVPEVSLSGAANIMEFSCSFKYQSVRPLKLAGKDTPEHVLAGEHQALAGVSRNRSR